MPGPKDADFVIDNSIVMTWAFEDKSDEYADDVLDSLTDAVAVVPSIWSLEVLDVLLTAERRKRIKESDSIRFITLLKEFPIYVSDYSHNQLSERILSLARDYSLSSYDATYLDLAIKMDLPIASLNNDLRKATYKAGLGLWKLKDI